MAENDVTYSFIDIAVWDGVREVFLSGQPIMVFSSDFEDLTWTNGAAARLFGYSSIGDFETEGPSGIYVALRQIRTASARIGEGAQMQTLLRVTSGMTSRLLPATVGRVSGSDGKNYVAVFIDVEAASEDEAARASSAIAGLDVEGAGAAIYDSDGSALAANALFDEMAIPAEEAVRLIRDVRGEDDRLVKRLVMTQPAKHVAVAVARLTDDPARHLLVAVPSAAPQEEPETQVQRQEASGGIDKSIDDNGPARPRSLLDVGMVSAERTQLETAAPGAVPATSDGGPPKAQQLPPAMQQPFKADLDIHRGPVRFVWKIDRNGRFLDISPEFASAVGPNAADVTGRTFEEIARVFELDPSGEIAASLKRRDTWSGKSVLWPVQGTDKRVPVDLAALPSYNRDREFEGYRGFGIARISEARPDPEALGHSLVETAMEVVPETTDVQDDNEVSAPTEQTPGPESGRSSSIDVSKDEILNERKTPRDMPSDDPFKGETPALETISPNPMRREADKIIDLNSKRRERPAGEALNPSEQAAFRQIGDTLNQANQSEPGPVEQQNAETLSAGEADASPTDGGIDGNGTAETPDRRQSDDLGRGERPAVETEPTVNSAEAEPAAASQPSEDVSQPDNESEGIDEGRKGLTAEFVEQLPLPILIHRNGHALYSNSAFIEMSGYERVADLNEAGGIDALFEGASEGSGNLIAVTADGEQIGVRTHMQSVPWNGGSALMFAFERSEDGEQSEPGVAPQPAALPQLTDVEELRAILDTATDGVVVLSRDGVIRSINGSASALFGYSAEEIEGKSFTVLFAQESQAPAIDYVHGLANNGVASVLNEGLEVLGREKNGGFLPLFMTIGRLEKSDGFCAVVRDITAWKQTEQALLDAQRNAESASTHKTEFLAKISHEIRTPLNAIIGFSELMAEERFGPIGNERYRSYLTDINKSGKYVLELVNDLLDISKIEAGKQDLEFDSVAVNDAVHEAVAMVQPQANRNRVIIRSSLDEDLPDVVADARSLKQIVLNLLSNSVRFTHSGGQVVVNTGYNARGEVVLRIKDTGIGMSTKEIETALQPFQQVASLGRARGDGTGLGLPLTKALVEANRAEFAIQSEPGRGTAVEIVFPPSRVLAS
jgi:PAS domain S-box-containing protein